MTAYVVNRRYRAWCNGQRFDWRPGQVVDLSRPQAEWANRDCEGVLSVVEPEPAKTVELVTPEGPADVTEYVLGEATPTGQPEAPQPEPEPEPAAEAPPRRRGGRPRKAR